MSYFLHPIDLMNQLFFFVITDERTYMIHWSFFHNSQGQQIVKANTHEKRKDAFLHSKIFSADI